MSRDLRDLFDRVVDVARGAALMTGTTLEVELAMAFTEYVPNKALGAIASEAMQEVGAPQWDEADFQLATAVPGELRPRDPLRPWKRRSAASTATGPRQCCSVPLPPM